MHAAILGCSVSGIAAYKLLHSLGYQVIGFDRKKMGNGPFLIYKEIMKIPHLPPSLSKFLQEKNKVSKVLEFVMKGGCEEEKYRHWCFLSLFVLAYASLMRWLERVHNF